MYPRKRQTARFSGKGFWLRLEPRGLSRILPAAKAPFALFEIGKGGFGFLSGQAFDPGEEIRGRLTTVWSRAPFDVRAVVCWAKEFSAPEEGCRFRIGVRFVEIGGTGREELGGLLDSGEMVRRRTYSPEKNGAVPNGAHGSPKTPSPAAHPVPPPALPPAEKPPAGSFGAFSAAPRKIRDTRRWSRYDGKGFTVRRKGLGLFGLLNLLRGRSFPVFEIGRQGLGFLAKRSFTVGDEFRAALYGWASNKPIEVDAQIRWVNRVEQPEQGFRYRVGVQFTSIHKKGQDELIRVLTSDEMRDRMLSSGRAAPSAPATERAGGPASNPRIPRR